MVINLPVPESGIGDEICFINCGATSLCRGLLWCDLVWLQANTHNNMLVLLHHYRQGLWRDTSRRRRTKVTLSHTAAANQTRGRTLEHIATAKWKVYHTRTQLPALTHPLNLPTAHPSTTLLCTSPSLLCCTGYPSRSQLQKIRRYISQGCISHSKISEFQENPDVI